MKASKMVACLSVSAVLLSLFASGASVTVPDTQPSAAAVLQAEEYVEDSLAAYLAAHAFDGTLSGRLDNNLTVEFAADPALMGSYAQVHLTGARATVLLGELET